MISEEIKRRLSIMIILRTVGLTACGSSKPTPLAEEVQPGPNSVAVPGTGGVSRATATSSVPRVGPGIGTSTSGNANQIVFVIVMENTNWSQIEGSADAPYINKETRASYSHNLRITPATVK